MSAGGIGFLAIVILLAFIIFNIYFIFKVLQFVIQSVNLYKKMVSRLDGILKLLIDIRDNTRKFKSIDGTASEDLLSEEDEEEFICENCKAVVPAKAKKCPKCGAEFE